MLARIALVAAALVIAALLAFTLHAVRLEADARSAVSHGLTPAAVARADALLRDAQRHNPDIRPEGGRGLLLASAGRFRDAAAILRGVVRKEPDNVRAVLALADVLDRLHDPGAAAVRRHAQQIAPSVKP